MNNTQLHIQGTTLSLKRFPTNQFDKSLRAWDAGDEYIIDTVCDKFELGELKRIVIVNDSFGALSCAMSRLAPQADIQVYTDSYMSKCGIEQNLKGSNLDKNNVQINSSLDLYDIESAYLEASSNELLLIKVPRTLAYLKYLLASINKVHTNAHKFALSDSTSKAPKQPAIIAGGMVKLITSSVVKAFEYAMHEVSTSLARKKSRLLFSQIAPHKNLPVTLIKTINDTAISFDLYNYPNVFCRDQVDIGARYILNYLPALSKNHMTVIDLGCGNGILGTSLLMHASQQNQSVRMIYIDESYMAIASARDTLNNSAVSETNKNNAQFIVSHSLTQFLKNRQQNVEGKSADIILCNPPFHQQSTIVDDIAWQMFSDAKKALKHNGELRIVGNRHLEHSAKLSKLFGGCKVVASNKKFVVLSSTNQ